MGKTLETVNRFYDTTENKKGEGLEALIERDMTFVGPLMRISGAKEYIESTRQFLQMHRATRMLKQFENGNDVCSIYEMDIATPSGGMLTLEITDWIQVANGRVARQKIYYDPREFAKAFGMG
ncbi:MAG: nuclear transport factor 2 family protein [Nitrososphaera sp.]|nr:nuclear transport factor 2 family protein [Nitrososphaera sp.]